MSTMVIVSIGIPAVAAFLLGCLVSHAKISSKLGKLEERTDSNKDRMNRLETKFDNFFLGLSTPEHKIKDATEIQLGPLIKKFDDFLTQIEKKRNPISTEQIGKLKTYRNKLLHGVPLDPEEYEDFQFLLKEIGKELPDQQKSEFDWIAAGLLGFVAGLIIGSLIKK